MTKLARTLTLVLLAAVVIIVALDASGPYFLRRTLGDDAAAAANTGELAYLRSGVEEDAMVAARAVADERGVVLTGFEVLTGGAIKVTVADTSKSIFLDRIRPLHRYYEVQVSRTARPGAGTPTTSTTKAG
jgi:hypothetical protein